MLSSFTWLDYSDRQKRRMLDVINLFSEKDTRDELGLGVVRDGFADMLFPGTSTIQTRARYFLLVPWIYLKLEKQRIPSDKIAERARKVEVELITTLLDNGETAGVIGEKAGRELQRLPSNVYWLGLRSWGLRVFAGSQEQYHQSLDAFYRRSRGIQFADDGEPIDGSHSGNWHSGLPPVPEDFPSVATLKLTRPEAEYLRERIITQQTDSLLAFLAKSGKQTQRIDFPWNHPQFDSFPAHIREQLHHAQCFSEVLNGATLLYNLMLAEKLGNDEYRERYDDSIGNWASGIDERFHTYKTWNRRRFWLILRDRGVRISYPTQRFINAWVDLIIGSPRASDITTNQIARQLIHERERALKRGKARLDNQRALELWSRAAGITQFSYRWGNAQRIIKDILAGLKRRTDNA